MSDNKRFALISVFDKSGLAPLLTELAKHNYSFISTGGTAKYIKEAGFKVLEVSSLTNFPEMLDGRVKTLHPKIFAGILARRDLGSHMSSLAEHGISTIDLAVLNLYPFIETVEQGASLDEIIEKIDIGGPSLLRAAAKNYESVTVVSSVEQYQDLITEINLNTEESPRGETSLTFRTKLAAEVFAASTQYDAAIASYMQSLLPEQEPIPKHVSLPLRYKQSLRYGENPQQKAALFVNPFEAKYGIANAEQLQGKELSYNNIADLDAAWSIVNEYEELIPCVAIIKHCNPCGVAIAKTPVEAYLDALSCDPLSAFGGIVACNTEIDLSLANELSQMFLEAIVAPSFTAEALQILATKKNLRLLKIASLKPVVMGEVTAEDIKIDNNLAFFAKPQMQFKKVSGGFLLQENDDIGMEPNQFEVVTKKQVSDEEWLDLIFAWKVVKHVKSNAVVTAYAGKTLGIGVGQTSRVKAVNDAVANFDFDTRAAVLASDAFFPFADSVEIAGQNHISAIIQPGGSIKDEEVIKACDELGIAMVFTKTRHFKH